MPRLTEGFESRASTSPISWDHTGAKEGSSVNDATTPNPDDTTDPADAGAPASDPAATSSEAHDDATGQTGRPGAVFESLREAVDDLADRAGPTVTEFSARAAEITAVAADRAAPAVRRAGDVAAGASQRLAERSRQWAADLRSRLAEQGPAGTSPEAASPESGSASPQDARPEESAQE